MDDRLRSKGSCDFDQFTSMIHTMLKAAWGEKWGSFFEAFPNGRDPQDVQIPVITYSILTKRPGLVGNSGHREIKPRHRQDFLSSDGKEPEAVSIYAQVFDHEIQFDLWEQSNTKLNKLADKFEDFMMTYAGYFKQQGVGEILFDRMFSQSGVSWQEDLLSRSYIYYVKLEKHIIVPNSVIKEVIGKVEILSDASDQSIESIDFKTQ